MHKLVKYKPLLPLSVPSHFVISVIHNVFSNPFMILNISYALSPKDWTYTHNPTKLRDLQISRQEVKITTYKFLYFSISAILLWVV